MILRELHRLYQKVIDGRVPMEAKPQAAKKVKPNTVAIALPGYEPVV